MKYWTLGVIWAPILVAFAGWPAEGGTDWQKGADGSFVRVTVVATSSPFTSTAYDVTVRGDSVVVMLVKGSACVIGQRQGLTLLGGKAAEKVWDELDLAHAFVPQPPPGARRGSLQDDAKEGRVPVDDVVYEFWAGKGKRLQRFWLRESDLLNSPRLVRLFRTLRAIVIRHAGSLPMRDVYYPPEKLGYLTMSATEEAEAVLDGWDRIRLPADGVPVVVGVHRVVVIGKSGRRREFTITIRRGESNRVHVVLK